MFPSSLASVGSAVSAATFGASGVAAHAPAATMDELPPWIPIALGVVALLAIMLIIVAIAKKRKSERDTLDDALADAKQATRDTASGRGRHSK